MATAPGHRLSDRVANLWRAIFLVVPYAWLLAFFLIPFVIVLKISFAESLIALPPYSPLFQWAEEATLQIKLSFANFLYLTEDNLYWYGYLNSIKIAAISTVLTLIIGYPMAYGIARASSTWRNILLLLVILPFWTSFLLRIYAWMGMLNREGVINNVLIWLGLTSEPIQMMNTDFAVYLGIVYSYLPFMILPLYSTLERLDLNLNEAAMDLGSRPMRVFFDVTLPLSMPGIIAGCLLTFIPATGEYVIPALLGSPSSPMIGRVLFDEFFYNRDWPVASAVAVVMLIVLVAPIMFFQYLQSREAGAAR
ncbi:putrescine transport system permease protein [Rhodoligotrophos appendicifer]|uniref:ABC transporter permease subunit n=1 Tax=Rhodoligotrophos appendicifer TaxID=987056 RepID=UPI00117E4EE8|nr:ABC transporter permease subunit [Rhodoligotrophos appendicifer]